MISHHSNLSELFVEKSISTKMEIFQCVFALDGDAWSVQPKFPETIEELSLIYDRDYEVEDLFIGIWPAFKDDRL